MKSKFLNLRIQCPMFFIIGLFCNTFVIYAMQLSNANRHHYLYFEFSHCQKILWQNVKLYDWVDPVSTNSYELKKKVRAKMGFHVGNAIVLKFTNNWIHYTAFGAFDWLIDCKSGIRAIHDLNKRLRRPFIFSIESKWSDERCAESFRSFWEIR